MKSIQFKKLNISDADVLSKLQMKKITGGHGPDGCRPDGYKCYEEEGEQYTCFHDPEGQCCCGHDNGNLMCTVP